MPSLEELRGKWFLDFSRPGDYLPFPPIARHRNTNVGNSTDRNRVEPKVDGQCYMKEWHDIIRYLIQEHMGEIFHAAWGLEDVQPLGYEPNNPTALDVLELLRDAKNNLVSVYPLICRNLVNVYYSTNNYQSMQTLHRYGVSNACLDNRYPAFGSNHQKFTYFKHPTTPKVLLGSIDLNWSRWDTSEHLRTPPSTKGRHPGKTRTHDLGIMVEGPALKDIEWTFRERWNDRSRGFGMRRRGGTIIPGQGPVLLPGSAPPEIAGNVLTPRSRGTHSIQVLHTYGRLSGPLHPISSVLGYSWSNVGEFTIWASYLNAIKRAQRYIYIEDQYFAPFGWPPWFNHTSDPQDPWEPEHCRQVTKYQKCDLFYQLGQAICRGVKVAVLAPESVGAEDPGVGHYWDYQRNFGAHYLANIANHSRGDFVIAYPKTDGSAFFVHSKIMICDDEFVLVGAANFNRRSMTYDSEIQLGIVDSSNEFARTLRKQLWKEHLTGLRPFPSDRDLDDPDAAYEIFKRGGGRLWTYTPGHPGNPPWGHSHAINRFVDPYAGPPL